MRLKTLMKQKGYTQTQLAELLGRDKSVVTNLLQGKRQLKADEAILIAKAFSVPVAELLGEQEALPGVAEQALIPFQGEPSRRRGARGVVRRQGKYFLEEGSGVPVKAFALEVRDESMALSGLLPGDIVVAELDAECDAGQIVVAQHYVGAGAETLIRRYQPPFLLPHSLNAAFAPLDCARDDVRLVAPVRKVVRLL